MKRTIALTLMFAFPAFAADPVREPVPSGEVARWKLNVEIDEPVKATANCVLISVGDRVTSAWCHDPLPVEKSKPWAYLFDPAGLVVGKDGISGMLAVRMNAEGHSFASSGFTASRNLEVKTSLIEGKPTGTIIGTLRGLGVEKSFAARITGGEVTREAELAKANALTSVLSWPGWLGPNQNFSATATKSAVVNDMARARLIWKSEYVGSPEMGSYRYGLCPGRLPAQGGASPVVAGGRVFQFRIVPTGEKYHRKHIESTLQKDSEAQIKKVESYGLTVADLQKTWPIDADEQVMAFDAATGRTLWKTTFPLAGLHLLDHKCALTNHTPYATADRVFAFGSLGVLRCLEAATGKVIWESNVPGYSETMAKIKANALAEETGGYPSRSFCHALNFADDVVLAPTGINACGLAAFNSATGKLLWSKSDRVLGNGCTPIVWRGGGKWFAIAAGTPNPNGKGVLTAFDLHTGEKAWATDGLGTTEYQPAIDGDTMIVNADKVSKEKVADTLQTEGRMAAYKLTPTGAERLWITPEKFGMTWYRATACIDGGIASIRTNRTLHQLDVKTGKVLRTLELPTGREDETHTSAMNGVFFPEMDSQHGHTGFYTLPPGDAKLAALWHPPHPHVTTYQVPLAHAWVDGRLFIRGGDGVYCYDLRNQ